MERKPVQFLADTSKANLTGFPEFGVVVLYRDGFGYRLPEIPNATVVEFEKFRVSYESYTPTMIVLIGLNRIINPSNRCDFVFSYLTTATPNITKISIDREPFIGEPWRVFFHYLFSRSGRWPEPHSYAVETNWRKWFFRDQNTCSMDAENIRLLIGNDTISDLPKINSKFHLAGVNEMDASWYEAMKKSVIEANSTPKLWVNGLLRECNKRFGLGLSMDSYRDNKDMTVPDVGVIRFVVEENRRRQAIYNAVVS